MQTERSEYKPAKLQAMTRARLCQLFGISMQKFTAMLENMKEEDWLVDGVSYKPQKRELLMPRQIQLIFRKYGSPL